VVPSAHHPCGCTMQSTFLATISSIVFLSSLCTSYKPVVIIHGILDDRGSLQFMADRITQMHPGTNVTVIDKLHGWRSISPLWFQVKAFTRILTPIMKANPEGVHLIGYSQGGLVARGLIQSISDHNIQTFVSLSSPQAGQFGDDFLHIYFPTYAKLTAYKLFYTEEGQLVSVGNYWRDPFHIPEYHNFSAFLALVNNDIETPLSDDYKDNCLRLNKLVLIGGPNDEIIQPWQSSQFGFYDETGNTVQDMEAQDIYLHDTFGLQSLDKAKKIFKLTFPGVSHLQWHKNATVIDEGILPYLD